MSPPDIPHVVALQIRFLEGSLVTELGPRFLTRFHEAALEHPLTRAFVAADDGGSIVGLALGSLDVHQFNGHVKPRVLAALVRSLLSRHGLTLTWRFACVLVEREPQPHIPAELLLLVVDARVRRQGIGQRLLTALESEFAREGVRLYRVAVRSQLEAARAFYLALGFEREQELLVLGHPMTYLTKRVQWRSRAC